jgi:enterochelin esterase-like enzyme
MRASLLPALLTLAAATPLSAQNPDRQRPDRGGGQVPELKNFTFEEKSLQSTAVGNTVPFGIFLPKGYDDAANKDIKWPLVIWLHGLWEDHMRFPTRGGAQELDKAVSDGKLPPCVFVTANGGRTSMYVNRKEERWEDLITEDLVAHLTKNYRVSEKRDQRAIMGVSLGGMAALRIALTKPDLFGAVGAHSSAVFAEDPEKLPDRIQGMANRLGLEELRQPDPEGTLAEGQTRCASRRRSSREEPARAAHLLRRWHQRPLRFRPRKQSFSTRP